MNKQLFFLCAFAVTALPFGANAMNKKDDGFRWFPGAGDIKKGHRKVRISDFAPKKKKTTKKEATPKHWKILDKNVTPRRTKKK